MDYAYHSGIDATYAIAGVGGIVLGGAVTWILPAPEPRANAKDDH